MLTSETKGSIQKTSNPGDLIAAFWQPFETANSTN